MRTSWDERYGAAGYLFGTEPNDFLVEVAERIPYGPVLCLADGEGRNSVFLASRGYPVMGVDSSTVGLEKARQLATARRVTVAYVQADLNQFRFEPDARAA